MFCPKCGSQIPDGHSFCSECGFSRSEAQKYLISDGGSDRKASSNAAAPAAVIAEAPVQQAVPPAQQAPVQQTTPSAQQASAQQADPFAQQADAFPANEDVQRPVMTEVKPKKKRTPMGAAPSAVICVVFGLLSFVFMFAAQTLLVLRNSLENGSISQAIADSNPADIKVGAIIEEDSLKAILEDADVNVDEIDEDTTLSELIPILFVEDDIDAEQVEEFFKESDIMGIFSSLTGNYEEYLITGEGSSELDVDSIMKEITSHREEIQEHLGIDINEYTDSIEEGLKSVKSEIKSLNAENALGGMGKYTYLIFSMVTFGITIFLAVGFCALIIPVSRRFKPALLTLGICSFAAGFILLLFTLLHPVILPAVMPSDPNAGRFVSGILSGAFFDYSIRLSLIFTGAGAALIAVRIVIAAVNKSKKRKQQAAESAVQSGAAQ